MVSLVELSEVTEEGVKFKSPYDGKEILLSPEKSISIQNSLGMQDVLMSLHIYPFSSYSLILWSLFYYFYFSYLPRFRHHDAA